MSPKWVIGRRRKQSRALPSDDQEAISTDKCREPIVMAQRDGCSAPARWKWGSGAPGLASHAPKGIGAGVRDNHEATWPRITRHNKSGLWLGPHAALASYLSVPNLAPAMIENCHIRVQSLRTLPSRDIARRKVFGTSTSFSSTN